MFPLRFKCSVAVLGSNWCDNSKRTNQIFLVVKLCGLCCLYHSFVSSFTITQSRIRKFSIPITERLSTTVTRTKSIMLGVRYPTVAFFGGGRTSATWRVLSNSARRPKWSAVMSSSCTHVSPFSSIALRGRALKLKAHTQRRPMSAVG